VEGIRIMGENKLRIALDSGESMFARRILPQLVTKLAIGLGALFLVGVLLAAIPNHRAPVVQEVSAEPGQKAQGTEDSTAPNMKIDGTRSSEKQFPQGVAHGNATATKAGDSTK